MTEKKIKNDSPVLTFEGGKYEVNNLSDDTKEIIEAERHEFDTKRRLWIIPAHKMKARKEHKIPLSDEALSIVEIMRKKHNHLQGNIHKKHHQH